MLATAAAIRCTVAAWQSGATLTSPAQGGWRLASSADDEDSTDEAAQTPDTASWDEPH